MTVREFYEYLNRLIPPELSLDGDCDGISCSADPDREVKRVLIALDVNSAVIDEAIEEGCEVILTHHPMLWGGLREVVAGTPASDRVIRLIRAGIAAMSFHTRLDVAEGGVNDILAGMLGLSGVTRFGEKGIGRIGSLESPLTAEMLTGKVRDALGAPFVEYSDTGRLIRRVAVCGGSGGSVRKDAAAAGADAFLCGEIGYHTLADSNDTSMSILTAGHFYTENPVCGRLFELVSLAGLTPVALLSNRTRAV